MPILFVRFASVPLVLVCTLSMNNSQVKKQNKKNPPIKKLMVLTCSQLSMTLIFHKRLHLITNILRTLIKKQQSLSSLQSKVERPKNNNRSTAERQHVDQQSNLCHISCQGWNIRKVFRSSEQEYVRYRQY